MKKITKNCLAICVLLILTSTLFAQNPVWSLPPNKLKNTAISALPAPGGCPTNYWGACNYNSDLSQYPSNIYADTAGNPLFFVVNGVVYNRNGYLIDGIGSSHTSSGDFGRGWSEVCIVPDPASCTKYFIFSSTRESATCTEGGSTPVFNQSPTCMHIDLAQPNTYYSTEYGKNVTGATSPNTAQDLYDWTTTKWPAGDSGTCLPHRGDIHFAVTKLLSNSYRLLFINNIDEIQIYKIDGVGIGVHWLQSYTVGSMIPLGGTDGSFIILSELEVFENTTHNRAKLAFSAVMSGTADWNLAFADFDLTTGVYKTGTGHTVCYNDGGSCCTWSPPSPDIDSKIGGIEFSPDGSKLFFTHTPNHCHNHPIDVVDTVGTTFTHYSPTNGNDFINSQIEYGKDGNMWFIGFDTTGTGTNRRLAKISNPNTPGSFTDNVVTLSSYPVDPALTPGNTTYELYKLAWYLPDQIDRETYGYQFYGSSTCCLFNSSYDKFKYVSGEGSGWSATSQTWTPTSNPLSGTGTATIGNEVRVAAGYTVTIQNMTIKFSPMATFVVEGHNGSTAGGTLILKKCTLDVDNRCLNKMWPGVRVWGDSTQAHTQTYQGYVLVDSMSVIKNAYIGVELGFGQGAGGDVKFNAGVPPKPADTTKAGGGILVAASSTFLNCQRGALELDYKRATAGNANTVTSCIFSTNATLIESGINPRYFFGAFNVSPNGGFIKATEFICKPSLSSYYDLDTGIRANNSSLVIDQLASSGVPCKIKNLFYGIYATNSSGNTATISSYYTTFNSNLLGAYLARVNNAAFTNNTFNDEVRTNSSGNHPNSTGLYLDNCTGFSVHDNTFQRDSSVSATNNLYGCVVSNSGSNNNWIWHNTFDNMYHGCQAQYVNYIYDSNSQFHNAGGGLVYLCNTFTNGKVFGADLYIPDYNGANYGPGLCPSCTTAVAGINYVQGTGDAFIYPQTGGNSFSHTSGAYDIWIDNTSAVYSSVYHYCPTTSGCSALLEPVNRNNCTESSFSPNVDCSTNPYTQGGGRLSDPITFLISKADEYKTMHDAYRDSLSMPNVDSSRIMVLMGSALSARHNFLDEAIRSLIREDGDSSQTVARNLMRTKAMELPHRSRLETALDLHDAAWANNELSAVISEEGHSPYSDLYTLLINNMNSEPSVFMLNSATALEVKRIANNATDYHTVLRAHTLLQEIGASNYEPIIQVVSDSTVARKASSTLTEMLQSSLTCKPNPFKDNTRIVATVIPKTDNAYVIVTDMLGKEVVRYHLTQGDNEINFNASGKDQQVFFCTLIVDGVKIKTHKIALIK